MTTQSSSVSQAWCASMNATARSTVSSSHPVEQPWLSNAVSASAAHPVTVRRMIPLPTVGAYARDLVPARSTFAANAVCAARDQQTVAHHTGRRRTGAQLFRKRVPLLRFRANSVHRYLAAPATGDLFAVVADDDAIVVRFARLMRVDERHRAVDRFAIAAGRAGLAQQCGDHERGAASDGSEIHPASHDRTVRSEPVPRPRRLPPSRFQGPAGNCSCVVS